MSRIKNIQPELRAQDWSALQPGDAVHITEPSGRQYQAYVETKTDSSDVVWIRTADLGSRHLLDHFDGIVISIPVHAW